MELFGIGPMELILILVVALMVFGPDRLPTIGAKLGHAMRDMRRATCAISEEISTTRAAIEAPAKELVEPFQDVASAAKMAGGVAAAVRNPGEAIRQSVLKELNTPAKAGEAASTSAEPRNTIAPPDRVEGISTEPDGAPPVAEESLALSDASPAAAAGLPVAIDTPPAAAAPNETISEGDQVASHPAADEPPFPSTVVEPRLPEQ